MPATPSLIASVRSATQPRNHHDGFCVLRGIDVPFRRIARATFSTQNTASAARGRLYPLVPASMM
jgi:hypothetical protein